MLIIYLLGCVVAFIVVIVHLMKKESNSLEYGWGPWIFVSTVIVIFSWSWPWYLFVIKVLKWWNKDV